MSNRKFLGHRLWRLDELFSGDHRAIVIPDLQRDYCWGDAVHTNERKDLVGDFVRTLIEMYKPDDSKICANHEDFNLGLIYGYEQPHDQVQLCDGQQRITTLYLLIGMLNRHLADDSLERYLISDYEKKDDREPYLRYSIRETSLYFMSDLVCHFFIHGENQCWPVATDKISECSWYYGDYDRDPSICSMCKALVVIEREISKRPNFDWKGFAEFLLHQLTFLYCDMETRENGEETFVVINTTGEPLSASQNLKPKIAFAKINAGENGLVGKWEEIESWFWTHRENNNDTSDAGFDEFLRWVTLFHCIKKSADQLVLTMLESDSGAYTFPVEEIPFSDIWTKFCAVRRIYETYSDCADEVADKNYLSMGEKDNGRLKLIDLYKFLPVVLYVEKFDTAESIDVCRIFRYFENVAEYQSKEITRENQSLSQAVRLVDSMPEKDILSFLKCKDVSKHILPDEERRKLDIISKAGKLRCEVESAFWDVQKFDMFGGEITPILDWSMVDGVFSFKQFKSYETIIDEMFEVKDGASIDNLRRAMLSYDLVGYPVRDGKNLSFCNEAWQWKKVVKANSNLIRKFLDELISGVDCGSIIGRCRKDSKWYEIACNKEALSYCENKNVQEDPEEGIILIKKIRATRWFPIDLLKETRERFGAEQITGFCDGEKGWIGFTRIIKGREFHLQRWLSPREGEADLYLMKGSDPESYVEADNVNGKDDLEKFRCMKVADGMTSSEVTKGVLLLVQKCSESDLS